MKKQIFIDTMGCPKNHNDSELVSGLLTEAGFAVTEDPLNADAVMVNTCGFISDAKVESIDRTFELYQLKKEDAALVVTGCLSQRYSEELFSELPEADIMLGVNDYHKLPELLNEYFSRTGDGCGERRLCAGPYEGLELDYNLRKPKGGFTTTLKISEGCNNRCTYCIIPEIRGEFRSRPIEEIVDEAEKLAETGIRELIIIGQDVTAYGRDIYGEFALDKLIRRLDAIEGIRWIRLLYCYEDEITEELIDAIAQCDSVCKYIDIPLQHCSDNVLKRMNRRSTKASILEKLRLIRQRVPEIAIRTTLITGFPGETEEDFQELLEFVDDMKFERLGVFSYSREEGTPAYNMKNQVDEDVKQDRLDMIMQHQMNISHDFNESLVGRTFEVVVEEQDEDGSYIGRTFMDAPEIDDSVLFTSDRDLLPGDFVKVSIIDAFDYDLVGREEI